MVKENKNIRKKLQELAENSEIFEADLSKRIEYKMCEN